MYPLVSHRQRCAQEYTTWTVGRTHHAKPTKIGRGEQATSHYDAQQEDGERGQTQEQAEATSQPDEQRAQPDEQQGRLYQQQAHSAQAVVASTQTHTEPVHQAHTSTASPQPPVPRSAVVPASGANPQSGACPLGLASHCPGSRPYSGPWSTLD